VNLNAIQWTSNPVIVMGQTKWADLNQDSFNMLQHCSPCLDMQEKNNKLTQPAIAA
jgi:hypothetical protein